jgi:RNA polymerase sigma factor (sigma-70 family)
MSDRQNAEDLFLGNVDWIGRAAAKACRRQGLEHEAEEFATWVRMKMLQDDYAVLRKFRGESDVKTYIVSVVVRYAHAYSRERRGRWRPSAATERLGPPARELETLVRRDRYSLAQAGQKLRTAGQTTLSDLELARLLAAIPERPPLRPEEVAAEPVLNAARGTSRADEHVTASEEEARRRELRAALARAMRQLAPEDRMIIRMHFRDGRTLADVARSLHIEQKPLYRRVPRLRERMRELLEADGVSSAVLGQLLNRGET